MNRFDLKTDFIFGTYKRAWEVEVHQAYESPTDFIWRTQARCDRLKVLLTLHLKAAITRGISIPARLYLC